MDRELIINISPSEYKEIKDILETTYLSTYLLDKKDFVAIKNNANSEIIAIGRIYNIGNNIEEVSGLWVKEEFRGQKLGQIILENLLKYKYSGGDLFLCTNINLEKYYGKVGFKVIKNNYPDKFNKEKEFAKSIGLKGIVMKYNNINK